MTSNSRYEDLFHKVTKAMDPGSQPHRLGLDNNQLANTYREGLSEIYDKSDPEYQRQLALVNKQSLNRMMEQQARHEWKKQQNAIKRKNEEMQKEMEECTFSPRIYTRNKEGKMFNDRVGDRSTKSQ